MILCKSSTYLVSVSMISASTSYSFLLTLAESSAIPLSADPEKWVTSKCLAYLLLACEEVYLGFWTRGRCPNFLLKLGTQNRAGEVRCSRSTNMSPSSSTRLAAKLPKMMSYCWLSHYFHWEPTGK